MYSKIVISLNHNKNYKRNSCDKWLFCGSCQGCKGHLGHLIKTPSCGGGTITSLIGGCWSVLNDIEVPPSCAQAGSGWSLVRMLKKHKHWGRGRWWLIEWPLSYVSAWRTLRHVTHPLLIFLLCSQSRSFTQNCQVDTPLLDNSTYNLY